MFLLLLGGKGRVMRKEVVEGWCEGGSEGGREGGRRGESIGGWRGGRGAVSGAGGRYEGRSDVSCTYRTIFVIW